MYPSFLSSKTKGPILKLTNSEVVAVRNLIDGYRQSASFLHRSADELERLLKQCEAYTDEKPGDTSPSNATSNDVNACPHTLDKSKVISVSTESEVCKSNGSIEVSTTTSSEVNVTVSSSSSHGLRQQVISMDVDLDEVKKEPIQPVPGLLHLRSSETPETMSKHIRTVVSSTPLLADHLHSPTIHVRTQRSPHNTPVTQYQPSNIHHHKQVIISQSHPHSIQHGIRPQKQLGGLPSPQQQLSSHPQQQPTIVALSHNPHPSPSQNTIHTQKVYPIRQGGTQQVRHLQQQSRQQHVHQTSYHQVGSHHQTIFNFDTSSQQLLEPRQKHVHHQRLSPMPYHSVLSPVSSPHLQELSRQSLLHERQPPMQDSSRQLHLQDLNRQTHIQEASRQSHLQDMSHQSHIQDMSHQSHIQDMSHQSHIQDMTHQPHIQEMSLQPHIQEMSHQPHIQEMGHQPHIQDMNRQSHSEYGHSMVFDAHPSH